MNASDTVKRARKLLAAATPWPWKLSGGYVDNRKSVLVESVPLAKKERGYAVAYLGDDAQTWADGRITSCTGREYRRSRGISERGRVAA